MSSLTTTDWVCVQQSNKLNRQVHTKTDEYATENRTKIIPLNLDKYIQLIYLIIQLFEQKTENNILGPGVENNDDENDGEDAEELSWWRREIPALWPVTSLPMTSLVSTSSDCFMAGRGPCVWSAVLALCTQSKSSYTKLWLWFTQRHITTVYTLSIDSFCCQLKTFFCFLIRPKR